MSVNFIGSWNMDIATKCQVSELEMIQKEHSSSSWVDWRANQFSYGNSRGPEDLTLFVSKVIGRVSVWR